MTIRLALAPRQLRPVVALCAVLGAAAGLIWPPGDLGQSGPGFLPSDPHPANPASYRQARVADPNLATGDPNQAVLLTDPLWAFGLNLLARQAAKSGGDIVLSPVSLHAVLSMLLMGALGQTEEEMRHALHLTALVPERRNTAWANLIGLANHTERAEVRVAMAMWMRPELRLLPAFSTAQSDFFAADSYPLPPESARAAAEVNAWIAERTGNRITDLVGNVDPATLLLLVNTVYAKVGWTNFRDDETESAPFTLPDGSRVDVPTMHGATWGEVTVAEDYDAMPLRTEGSLTLWVVLPQGDTSPESVIDTLQREGRSALTSEPVSAKVEVFLPRFRVEHTAGGLVDDLTGMGMLSAFALEQADFGGLTDTGPVYIGQVLHKAMIDVNEEGIEAAAASAVSLDAGALPPERTLIFRVDRPFLAVLTQDNSEAPLFMALVRDPR